MELFDIIINTIREAIQSLTFVDILVVKQIDKTYLKLSNRFNGCINLKYEQVYFKNIQELRNIFETSIAHLAAERLTK